MSIEDMRVSEEIAATVITALVRSFRSLPTLDCACHEANSALFKTKMHL